MITAGVAASPGAGKRSAVPLRRCRRRLMWWRSAMPEHQACRSWRRVRGYSSCLPARAGPGRGCRGRRLGDQTPSELDAQRLRRPAGRPPDLAAAAALAFKAAAASNGFAASLHQLPLVRLTINPPPHINPHCSTWIPGSSSAAYSLWPPAGTLPLSTEINAHRCINHATSVASVMTCRALRQGSPARAAKPAGLAAEASASIPPEG